MGVTYAPSAVLKAAKTYFALNYKPELSWIDAIAYRSSSEYDKEDYPWLGQAPQMAALKDEINFTPLSDTNYQITNSTYTAGVEFKKEDIDDNKSNTIRMRILQLAATAAAHPNSLLTSAITGGTSTVGYDGINFFSATHTARAAEGGSQSNLLNGTGTTTSAFATDIAVAKAAMLNFNGENGEPFFGDGLVKWVAMVPPLLEKPAKEAMNAVIISNTSNVLQGMADVIVNPRLTATDVNDWYLFAVTDARRPFIFQERTPLMFSSQENEDSDYVFSKRRFRYKVEARYAVGYGYWQCAVKTTN